MLTIMTAVLQVLIVVGLFVAGIAAILKGNKNFKKRRLEFLETVMMHQLGVFCCGGAYLLALRFIYGPIFPY